MNPYDFIDRELVLEKLKEWGVMSDLSILTQVISKHVDKLEYDDDDSNSTRETNITISLLKTCVG